MATLQIPASAVSHGFRSSNFASLPLHQRSYRLPVKTTRIHASGNHSFLELSPESIEPEHLDIDVRWHDPSGSTEYDAVIIGCGPSGLRLAEQASARGLRLCCIDPSPLSGWPNNYGAWVDEFEAVGLESCLDKTWPMASIIIDDGRTRHVDRPYGRVGRRALKTRLLEACAARGVRFHRAKAWNVLHEEFKSSVSCSDGSDVHASLVVDASGHASPFIEYDKPRSRTGYQIAHGILAEVDSHPFDLDKMLLMDWRDSHLGNEPYLRYRNNQIPTFLYAMPFDANHVFLEETSLVARPILSYSEVKKRMVARLRQLGIEVKRVIEDEKCVIPMGGPLPSIPQSMVGIGGTAGMVHPSSGYMVARTMAMATVLADAMAECLGETRMVRGRQLHSRMWGSLWPAERRHVREYYCFGMEALLKLDLEGTRRFFDAFFELDPYYWHGFLSNRLSLWELALFSMSLFKHASNPTRLDILAKCSVPFLKMVGDLVLQSV